MITKPATAALLVTMAAALAATIGCTTQQHKLPHSRARQVMDDSAFAAGAGRAPTPETSHAFARILVSQGRDRDAIYVLGRLLRDHPRFIPAYNELASIYARAERLDDALAAIHSGLKHAPHDAVLHNNLGVCHMLQENHDLALEAFTTATQAMPANPTFRSNRAAALCLTGRVAEGESEYLTVLDKRATRQNLTILQRARERSTDHETNSDAESATADDSHSCVDVDDEARRTG